MREALFRGKRVDNGEWVYWNQFGEYTKPYFGQYEAHSHVSELDVICETVCQYTGLTDKNGIKIFEGDILEVETSWYLPKKEKNYSPDDWFNLSVREKTTWSVEHKNYFTANGWYAFGKDRRFKTTLTRSTIINTKAVVIGNIHEVTP